MKSCTTKVSAQTDIKFKEDDWVIGDPEKNI